MALFTALIAVGAFLKVPTPICPLTFQIMFCTLAGVLLGGEMGAVCVCCYIFLGLIGLPIFTAGGGISYVFQPTFGYLIGFVFGAYAAGKIANAVPEPSFKRLLTANFTSLAIAYLFGVIYYWAICRLYLQNGLSFGKIILYCLLMPVVGDIFECIFAAAVCKRLFPALKGIINGVRASN